ncbi:MAG: hypothetical protein MHM6MM_008398 [Cercozoa sp. M6MM]
MARKLNSVPLPLPGKSRISLPPAGEGALLHASPEPRLQQQHIRTRQRGEWTQRLDKPERSNNVPHAHPLGSPQLEPHIRM